MSDHPLEDLADLHANAKSRDERLALIEQSLDIEAELRDSPTWRYLDHRLTLQRETITAQLAALDPGNVGAVAKLQAKAMSVENFSGWIAEIINTRAALEHEINVEDGRLPADQ